MNIILLYLIICIECWMLLYFYHKSNNFFICRGHIYTRGKSIRGSRWEQKKKRREERRCKMRQKNVATIHRSLFTPTAYFIVIDKRIADLVIYILTESRANDENIRGILRARDSVYIHFLDDRDDRLFSAWGTFEMVLEQWIYLAVFIRLAMTLGDKM